MSVSYLVGFLTFTTVLLVPGKPADDTISPRPPCPPCSPYAGFETPSGGVACAFDIEITIVYSAETDCEQSLAGCLPMGSVPCDAVVGFFIPSPTGNPASACQTEAPFRMVNWAGGGIGIGIRNPPVDGGSAALGCGNAYSETYKIHPFPGCGGAEICRTTLYIGRTYCENVGQAE